MPYTRDDSEDDPRDRWRTGPYTGVEGARAHIYRKDPEDQARQKIDAMKEGARKTPKIG
jgi:hypothetical protein